MSEAGEEPVGEGGAGLPGIADDEIDALCELIDAGPGGASPHSDVDELLGCLANPANPAKAAKVARAALGQGSSSSSRPPLAEGSAAGAVEDGMGPLSASTEAPDLPEPTLALPPEVVPVPFIISARFHFRCEVDVKKVAFGLRHAEYNPRKHGSITVRLFDPRTTALVRASGCVTITGSVNEELLKRSAKKVAWLVRRCGHEDAKFADYAVTSMLCKADMRFPVRLESLAARWRRNAMYEPEIYCGCVFRTRVPRATFLVTSGGKVLISGLRTMEDIKEALRRAYPVFREFQR